MSALASQTQHIANLITAGKRQEAAEACFGLACNLQEIAPIGLALQTYQYLLNIVPDHKEGRARFMALQGVYQKMLVPFNEGSAYLERGDMENAALAFRQALAIHPRVPDALYNLGLALYHLRRLDEALAAFAEAIRLQPGHFQALSMLGDVYQNAEHYDKALAVYRQAIAVKPDYFKVWANLGKLLQKMGDDAAAVSAYEEAHRLEPQNAEVLAELTHRLHHLCRWDKREAITAQFIGVLQTTKQSAAPFITCLYTPPRLQLNNAMRWSVQHFPHGVAYDRQRPLNNKLRIGYLSADFHHHATAFLISELFERHDRDQFDIFAYSCGIDDGSAQRKRIANAVDTFHDIRMMDNRSAAELIRRDAVDIMVDLKGYTQGERLGVMALRPAPLQMHYLGYPGTTGAPFIDYFIADSVTAPAGADASFSECLIRLPHCYQMNDRKRPVPSTGASRAAYGLPEQGFVFCGFNRTYKITPVVFDVWMRLLAAMEGSVLWLYEQHPEASVNLRREAATRGIDPARLVIATCVSQEEHLARYRHADLFLDTFPVCGHTTASDALWCGVPVVTMSGENFAGRVAASLLHAVSLPELIATDIAGYEALALALACDPARLGQLRRHLAEGRMHFPLFDSAATTRALEAAYRQAAERHRTGLRPQTFSLSS